MKWERVQYHEERDDCEARIVKYDTNKKVGTLEFLNHEIEITHTDGKKELLKQAPMQRII